MLAFVNRFRKTPYFIIMPSGSVLTIEERVKVLAYSDAGLSVRQIAKKICRSPTAVHHVITLKENYASTPHT